MFKFSWRSLWDEFVEKYLERLASVCRKCVLQVGGRCHDPNPEYDSESDRHANTKSVPDINTNQLKGV